MISLSKQYKYCHIWPFPPKAIRPAEKTDSLFQRISAWILRFLSKEKIINLDSLLHIKRSLKFQEKPIVETLVSNDDYHLFASHNFIFSIEVSYKILFSFDRMQLPTPLQERNSFWNGYNPSRLRRRSL
jgi:hypothetical protein